MAAPPVSSSSSSWDRALELARAAGRYVSRIGEDAAQARRAAEQRHAERYREALAGKLSPSDAAAAADRQDSADAIDAFATLTRAHYARLLDASVAA